MYSSQWWVTLWKEINNSSFLAQILATIAGGWILWVVSEKAKRGKLIFNIVEKRFLGSVLGSAGTKDIEYKPGASGMLASKFWVHLDCYNSSQDTKSIRNIKIVYSLEGREQIIPGLRGPNPIESFNFSPKRLEEMHLTGVANHDIDFRKCEIHLRYLDEKNRQQNILLHSPSV